MLLFATTATLPGAIQVERIDASYLSLVVGGVTTGIFVAVIFILIGWLLVKYGAVKVGGGYVEIVPSRKDGPINPEVCVACQAEHERSTKNESNIADLFVKYNAVKDSLNPIQIDLGVIKTDISYIKTGVAELQGRRRGLQQDG